jgi:hypothetical protein
MARLRLDPSKLQVTSFESETAPAVAANALAVTRPGYPCTGTTCSGISYDFACITVYDPDC